MIDSFLADPHTSEGCLWILDDPADTAAIAALVDARAAALGGVTLGAEWRDGLTRPFGPLLDIIEDAAAYLEPRRPEVLDRFAWTLSNVLYPWRKVTTRDHVGQLRAGLADLALRGDRRFVHEFYQKRNVRPQVVALIVRLVLEAARVMAKETPGPVVLHVQNAHLADDLTLSVFDLLRRYAERQHVALKICLVGPSTRPGPFADFHADVRTGWVITRRDGTRAASSPDLRALCTPHEIDALGPASVYALPFRPADWLDSLSVDLRPAAAAATDKLLAHRMLTRVGTDRLRFTRGDVRETIAATCAPETVRAWHDRLLHGEEADDPFAAAWHATRAESPGRRTLYLDAMARAWAVSAYDCALAFARAAFAEPTDGRAVNENLVLAMLNYEAGEYHAADRLLEAVREAPDPIDTDLVNHLNGYNAVFGTGDYAKGIRILSALVAAHEQTGDPQKAAYVRNSLAFAHFRSKQIADAMEAEQRNVRGIVPGPVADSFLETILQLNLGRLQSYVGDLESAIRTVEAGLETTGKEIDAHILLLSHATLGSLQAAAGRGQDALETYRYIFELLRNMQLDSVKDQVLFALAKSAPRVPADTTTRTDEILFYVHFHLCRLFQLVDAPSWAHAYRQAVLAAASAIDPAFSRTVADALDAPPPPALEREPTRAALKADDTLAAWGDVIREVTPSPHAAAAMAETLMHGGTVALVDEQIVGARGVRLCQSVVLYDPRSAETAARITRELGGSYVQRATAALVLPDGLDLFVNVEPRAGIQQVAALEHEWYARLPGLVPVGLNVQILSEAFDGLLYRILKAFAERSGMCLLAAAPFHLWRGDLATTPQQAVQDFLVTSVDRLCLAGRIVEKVHGPAAVQNIAKYRPRLSEDALVFESRGECLIELKRKGGYTTGDVLKVHPQTRAILDLCDGTRDVAALVERLTHAGDLASPPAERLASLLRGLWRHGALRFDPPVLAMETAAVSP